MEPRTIADLQRVKDDATVVAVCYASFLAGHLVVSLVMLVYTRDKSEYARFHAIQTLVAHIVALVLVAAVMLAYFALFFTAFFSDMAPSAHHAHAGPPQALLVMFPVVFCFVIGSIVGSFATAIVGVMRAMKLRDLSMPFIGSWVFARFFRGRRDEAAV